MDVFKATDQNLKNSSTVISHYVTFFGDFRLFSPVLVLFSSVSAWFEKKSLIAIDFFKKATEPEIEFYG